jgi:hypothetical protein
LILVPEEQSDVVDDELLAELDDYASGIWLVNRMSGEAALHVVVLVIAIEQ